MKKQVIVALSIFCIAISAIMIPYIAHIMDNQKNPDLIITNFGQYSNGYVGRDVVFEMSVSNQGAITAKNCMITLFDGKQGSQLITSQFFDIIPNSNKIPVKIKSGIYENIGTYQVKAELGCMNTKSQSTEYTLQISQ
jgi:hypothetical protein